MKFHLPAPRRIFKSSTFILPIFLLVACHASTPTPDAAAIKTSNSPLTCNAGADCDVKWGRALRWVLNNSKYKIENQSDAMIATAEPMAGSSVAAYVITKVAIGGGRFSIEFRADCPALMFGCEPPVEASKVSFVKYVLGV